MIDTKSKEDADLELYKTAFTRLNFQDGYLFKFSTVFLTVEGALGFLIRSGITDPSHTRKIVLLASVLGIFLSIVWALWLIQNDYWHSVWVGALKKIEADLPTENKLFNLNDRNVALDAGRKGRLVFKGLYIAIALPIGLFVAWAIVFFSCLCV